MGEVTSTEAAGLCFAHLSDPHLTTLGTVRWHQLFNKRLLGYLSWRRRRRAEHSTEVLDAMLEDLRRTRPDHVVITGDLTHIGLPDEFRQARNWLERVGVADYVTVIPGNHDAYIRTAWDRTWTHWQDYMQSDPGRQQGGDWGMFPTLRVRNGVALIGLSSAVPTAPFVAAGRLGAEQRERLACLLRETGERGLFRLVLLHHPPRVEDDSWRRRLADARELCEILCEQGAELVLHGHGHANSRSAIACAGGEIPSIGIPSASYAGHKPERNAQYYLYRVAREGGQWRVQVSVRGWEAGSGEFVLRHEHHFALPVMVSTSC
jgi:3',5'-cyclic AMP phosphodiesterase CpdA